LNKIKIINACGREFLIEYGKVLKCTPATGGKPEEVVIECFKGYELERDKYIMTTESSNGIPKRLLECKRIRNNNIFEF
jgi:hypothetical protein